jgi:hypothetical protein
MQKVLALLAVTAATVSALDTTEPFDPGFTDNEVYVGFDGIGAGEGGKSTMAEYVAGIGVTDRLSTVFSLGLASNEFLAEAEAELGIGLFYTLVDTERFKLDLMSSLTSTGAVDIATECNLDFDRAGLQLTLEQGLYNDPATADRISGTTTIAPLAWYSLSDAMQILAAVDFGIAGDAGSLEIGSLAVGYNAVLSEALELITEVGFAIPQNDETFSAGVLVGFVATLP